MDWNLVAEALSLFSGLALAWPALRLNKRLRQGHQLTSKAHGHRPRNVKEIFQLTAQAYTDTQWSPLDHYLTVLGVTLFVLSSAIKVYLLLC